jgi:hypothetical protein
MTRRRRLVSVDSLELDYAPAPELVLEAWLPAAALEARRPAPELEPRAPVPLDVIELAWSHAGELPFLEAYVARSVRLAGGFRPTLERAFGMR